MCFESLKIIVRDRIGALLRTYFRGKDSGQGGGITHSEIASLLLSGFEPAAGEIMKFQNLSY